MEQAAFTDEIRKLREAYPTARAAILPAIHRAHEIYGYLTPEALRAISEALEIEEGYILDIVTFYHLFYTRPRGKYHFHICTNLSCALNGAYRILETLQKTLGVGPGEITPDGLFSYEEIECIGMDDHAPAALLNLEAIGPLSPEGVRELIHKLQQEEKHAP